MNRDLLGNRMRRYVPFYGTNLNNFLTQLPNNFITADEIILQHTLYPYYARFFDASRKENALQTMLGEGKQHSSLMLLMGNEQTKTKHDKYLRYCTFCSQEDMEQYLATHCCNRWTEQEHYTHQRSCSFSTETKDDSCGSGNREKSNTG